MKEWFYLPSQKELESVMYNNKKNKLDKNAEPFLPKQNLIFNKQVVLFSKDF